jgi:NADH-ubiquinone oxidoreductase chain 5
MEGPTPVSALIHAATLVTAGIYLMLRSSPLLENAPTTLVVMAWIGAATAFYGSVSGLLVNDLKRVIAFSTCSQLGYMVIAVGLSQYHVGLFHLVTHASFKACLFMAAGSVLHSMADEQDMRRLGGLVALLPMTYTAMLIASMSLLALPGLTGFYSKDHILELAAGCYSVNGFVVYVTGTLAASVTAFYSTRLLTLVFGSTPRANQKTYTGVHDAPVLLAAPILMLALLAIGFGFMAKDLWLGMGTDFLSSVLPVNPTNVALVEAEFALSPVLKMIPLMATLTGIFGAFYLYQTNMRFAVSIKSTEIGRVLYWFINGQWHWNSLVTNGVILPSLAVGHVASKILDRGAIETVGPFGLSQTLTSAGRSVAAYDTSIVTSYALYMVLGFLGLAVVLVAPVHSNNVALLMLFVASLTLTQQART